MKKPEPSNFRKLLEPLARTHDTRKVFDGFVRLYACALAAQTREPEYLEEARRWQRDELDAFARAGAALVTEMETRPYEDLIGTYYMEFALSTKGQQWNGEFHTPKTICDLMARMTLADSTLPADGPITVAEPACGAGAMILSLAEAMPPDQRHRLRVTATDINRTACDMTYINTTLWGIPCEVVHGNTISLQTWGRWRNIHWQMPWLRYFLGSKPAAPQPAPTAPDAAFIAHIENQRQQPTAQLELLTVGVSDPAQKTHELQPERDGRVRSNPLFWRSFGA